MPNFIDMSGVNLMLWNGSKIRCVFLEFKNKKILTDRTERPKLTNKVD